MALFALAPLNVCIRHHFTPRSHQTLTVQLGHMTRCILWPTGGLFGPGSSLAGRHSRWRRWDRGRRRRFRSGFRLRRRVETLARGEGEEEGREEEDGGEGQAEEGYSGGCRLFGNRRHRCRWQEEQGVFLRHRQSFLLTLAILPG